ncbi:MAG: HAD-IIA family hydrolase [Syntrophaceae bacterium]|nr:HAD-IIA family hydrolase [Syntrophaceae bacterium]
MRYKAILADLDGTINRGSILLPGVHEIYSKLSQLGVKWYFLSNNATLLAEGLCEKIRKWGLSVDPWQVVNSASVLIREIETVHREIRIMVIGEKCLSQGCSRAGAILTEDPKQTEAVVVALDRDFSYAKMRRAHKAIQAGSKFWATNLDVTFPDEENFSPGAGSVVAAIATAAGVQPERIFGKPFPDMAEMALAQSSLERFECLLIGDRLDTDMLCAKNANMDFALVLSGATTSEMLSESSHKPEYVFSGVSDLLQLYS